MSTKRAESSAAPIRRRLASMSNLPHEG
jgi:hypothetical protein